MLHHRNAAAIPLEAACGVSRFSLDNFEDQQQIPGMDPTEQLAERYLLHRGHRNVTFEPDGNVPPDFLIDDNIAVEVRRLNQTYVENGVPHGLEKANISTWQGVKRLLGRFDRPTSEASWYIRIRLSRPVEQWKLLRPRLEKGLRDFAALSLKRPGPVACGQGVELEVIGPAGAAQAQLFLLGSLDDQQACGWLFEELENNIQRCVDEKARKVAPYRQRYSQWWLILVDHIGYALNEDERDMFHDDVNIRHDWGRIVLLDPRDHTRAFNVAGPASRPVP